MKYKFLYILLIISLINKCKQLNGIFNIKSNGKFLNCRNNIFVYSSFKNPREQNFRIMAMNSEKSFQIEIFLSKAIIGVAQDTDKLTILDKENPNSYWNFHLLDNNQYLIQNNGTKKFLDNSYLPKCSITLNNNFNSNETKKSSI